MHLLATSSTISIDDLVEPVDLRQPPGDIVILSFADSDLAGLAAAGRSNATCFPACGLPICATCGIRSRSISGSTAWQHAKVVVVRLLGGLDWWRYGVERLSSLARERSIALALLPGEDRDDPRLAEASTLPDQELDALLRFFREGGPENLGSLLRRLAQHAGSHLDVPAPRPLPRMAGYIPGEGAVDLDRLVASLSAAIGRASRSCSIARCCLRPTRRRSMRFAAR